jgi:hypothetical protein
MPHFAHFFNRNGLLGYVIGMLNAIEQCALSGSGQIKLSKNGLGFMTIENRKNFLQSQSPSLTSEGSEVTSSTVPSIDPPPLAQFPLTQGQLPSDEDYELIQLSLSLLNELCQCECCKLLIDRSSLGVVIFNFFPLVVPVMFSSRVLSLSDEDTIHNAQEESTSVSLVEPSNDKQNNIFQRRLYYEIFNVLFNPRDYSPLFIQRLSEGIVDYTANEDAGRHTDKEYDGVVNCFSLVDVPLARYYTPEQIDVLRDNILILLFTLAGYITSVFSKCDGVLRLLCYCLLPSIFNSTLNSKSPKLLTEKSIKILSHPASIITSSRFDKFIYVLINGSERSETFRELVRNENILKPLVDLLEAQPLLKLPLSSHGHLLHLLTLLSTKHPSLLPHFEECVSTVDSPIALDDNSGGSNMSQIQTSVVPIFPTAVASSYYKDSTMSSTASEISQTPSLSLANVTTTTQVSNLAVIQIPKTASSVPPTSASVAGVGGSDLSSVGSCQTDIATQGTKTFSTTTSRMNVNQKDFSLWCFGCCLVAVLL